MVIYIDIIIFTRSHFMHRKRYEKRHWDDQPFHVMVNLLCVRVSVCRCVGVCINSTFLSIWTDVYNFLHAIDSCCLETEQKLIKRNANGRDEIQNYKKKKTLPPPAYSCRLLGCVSARAREYNLPIELEDRKRKFGSDTIRSSSLHVSFLLVHLLCLYLMIRNYIKQTNASIKRLENELSSGKKKITPIITSKTHTHTHTDA